MLSAETTRRRPGRRPPPGTILDRQPRASSPRAAADSPTGGKYFSRPPPSGRAATCSRRRRSAPAAGGGSVERHFDVQLAAGGAGPGERSDACRGAGSPAGRPAAGRLARGRTLVAYLEIYGAARTGTPERRVTFELSRSGGPLPLCDAGGVQARSPRARWTADRRHSAARRRPGRICAVVTITLPGSDPIRGFHAGDSQSSETVELPNR